MEILISELKYNKNLYDAAKDANTNVKDNIIDDKEKPAFVKSCRKLLFERKVSIEEYNLIFDHNLSNQELAETKNRFDQEYMIRYRINENNLKINKLKARIDSGEDFTYSDYSANGLATTENKLMETGLYTVTGIFGTSLISSAIGKCTISTNIQKACKSLCKKGLLAGGIALFSILGANLIYKKYKDNNLNLKEQEVVNKGCKQKYEELINENKKLNEQLNNLTSYANK